MNQLEALVERAFREGAEHGIQKVSESTKLSVSERITQLEVICNHCSDTICGQCIYHREYRELKEKLNNL